MLEEAKKIVSPEAEPVYKMKKTVKRKQATKETKKTKGVKISSWLYFKYFCF